MKINFNRPFLNFRGEPIMKTAGGHEPQVIKEVISSLLFDGEWVRSSGKSITPEDKMRAYDLSVRIYKSAGEVDITAEDAVLIKEAACALNPGGYAQIVKLIEN